MAEETTLVAEPAPDDGPPPAPARTTGDMVRMFFRGIGQTLITCGMVVLLFIVYEVWVTNWFSERENHKLRNALENLWEKGQGPLALPDGASRTLKTGEGIANIYIPRLGKDFAWTIVEGEATPSQAVLAKGPAHYGDSQLPGEIGNFAVAGHRVGKGEPFLNLDQLKAGDAVIIETGAYWFVYRVKGTEHGLTKDDSDGIPGREIVGSADGDPLYAVPDHPGLDPADATPPNERLMTMTTCHPKFTAENRMIVYAKLDYKVTWHKGDDKQKPAEIEKLYSEVKA